MIKIFVLYYSMYRHVETLAKAVAEGAHTVDGVEVTIKRMPEFMPEEIAHKSDVTLISGVEPVEKVLETCDYVF